MCDDSERMGEGMVVAYFKVLPRHSSGRTGGHNQKPWSGCPIPLLRFKPGNSQETTDTLQMRELVR
jgi:hypothetical protein